MTAEVAGVGTTEVVVMLVVAGVPIVVLVGLILLVARTAGRRV